jgi:DNA-directed RNA polymerase subunit RPC12/RpoP
MNTNFEKIRCPHCRKKILATFGTANFCPICHKPVNLSIELGTQYRCKACKHKFRSRETLRVKGKWNKDLRCPKCDSYKIEDGAWIDRFMEGW